jgi:hypothetical protein
VGALHLYRGGRCASKTVHGPLKGDDFKAEFTLDNLFSSACNEEILFSLSSFTCSVPIRKRCSVTTVITSSSRHRTDGILKDFHSHVMERVERVTLSFRPFYSYLGGEPPHRVLPGLGGGGGGRNFNFGKTYDAFTCLSQINQRLGVCEPRQVFQWTSEVIRCSHRVWTCLLRKKLHLAWG